ncbi:ATP-binding protein [Streptomyces sp. NPDC001817]|uniref:ATP-binding protein n=1 Tax=Streptomyces sp. NPDC001817 TaxID=3154398 RepID=UPI00331F4FA6
MPWVDPAGQVRKHPRFGSAAAPRTRSLLGPAVSTGGVGKPHIAVALAVAACRAGHSIYLPFEHELEPQGHRARDRSRPTADGVRPYSTGENGSYADSQRTDHAPTRAPAWRAEHR